MSGKAAEKGNGAPPDVTVHGAATLTAVTVDSFNAQLREGDGFVGDRARRAAFFDILARWREVADRKLALLGDVPVEEISKARIDEALAEGKPHEQALVLSAIEDYAGEMLAVIRRLLRTEAWRDTSRIAIGGGLKGGRFAEIAFARAELLARADGIEIELRPIHNDPDEAGLIGSVHLAPSWMFASFDDILAVDIGGSNIRCGIVRLNLDKADDLSKARVRTMELWTHGEEKLGRDEAVGRLVGMLEGLIRQAEKDGLSLAPFIGVGCPGSIAADGSIENGAQNLPGNWESSRFNLPAALWEAIPSIGGHETTVTMHNDAVVQGLSEVPFMQDVEHWGVLTIGTGLGNARFTNRARPNAEQKAAHRRGDARPKDKD
ncbi:ROK family protein [Ancylobacter oerskovii]|uniref:ROK family protein n=1 Tax=Ancylobacter oerskovii TaxID=459519 RepID=A0ABW4YR92_9HYPH|nr:ROK family protein [Ancylobacter oerskovii]MBS7545649.1 ROK family protein [Ancylobacter oerskovii]